MTHADRRSYGILDQNESERVYARFMIARFGQQEAVFRAEQLARAFEQQGDLQGFQVFQRIARLIQD